MQTFRYQNSKSKETCQKLLSGFFPLWGYHFPPPPTPSAQNHFAKQIRSEKLWYPPPHTHRISPKSFLKKWVLLLSAEVQKRKRSGTTAESFSRQRLFQWQQKRDRHRFQMELRNTPHLSFETSKTWTLNLRKGWKTTFVREELQTQGQEEEGRQERLFCITMKPKLLRSHSYYSRLCQVFPL